MSSYIDYSDLIDFLKNSRAKEWAEYLPEQIAAGLSHQRHGELAAWLNALDSLPELQPSSTDLHSAVTIGDEDDVTTAELLELEQGLKALCPWRKGPYQLFGVDIDTEWHSDWKWDRLLPHIAPLTNRLVLDVGCGNGYHCLRMLGEKAKRVIGIDPSPRFVVQFYMLKRFLGAVAADVLPLGIESVPANLQCFDTCFSMGVLYHRRSPIDHLTQLRDCLKGGGELVLETLIVDGPEGYSLMPKDRYAKMSNVWFIPSPDTLVSWLEKCGFINARCVDINTTQLDEQRATEWMTSQSLADFLDPNDRRLTIEGYPAPKRGIFIANRK